MIYRIKDWGKHFENNRSREMKRLEWVPVPNKMDGGGYAELVEHPNGAAHLGVWLAIIEIASRNDPRGVLERDGKPQTPQTLARISRLPAVLFEEVLERLLIIGWIEPKSNEIIDSHDGAEISHDGAPRVARAELNRTEENRTEVKKDSSSSSDDGFALVEPSSEKTPTVAVDRISRWFKFDFWPIYPRRVAKKAALKAALKVLPGKKPADILAGLVAQLPKYQAMIAAGDHSSVPHAATWLNDHRWEDEIESIAIPPVGRNGGNGGRPAQDQKSTYQPLPVYLPPED